MMRNQPVLKTRSLSDSVTAKGSWPPHWLPMTASWLKKISVLSSTHAPFPSSVQYADPDTEHCELTTVYWTVFTTDGSYVMVMSPVMGASSPWYSWSKADPLAWMPYT